MAIWLRNDPHLSLSGLVDSPLVLTYVSRLPLFIHLSAICFCLGCSAIFHLFQIHSKKWNEILAKLDYGGISLLIMGSSIPPIWYNYSCAPVFWLRNFFAILIISSCMICFVITMMPSMNQPKYIKFRAIMFCILGLSAGAPMLGLLLCSEQSQLSMLEGGRAWPWALGGLVYIFGAILYALRLPERWYPKRFDLVGSSHNIFHVMVIIGAAIHFNESMKLFIDRRDKVCPIMSPSIWRTM